MIRMIMKLVQNQNLTFTIGNKQSNSAPISGNGVPGIGLGSFFFSTSIDIYTICLPQSSEKFAYADYLDVATFFMKLEGLGGKIRLNHTFTVSSGLEIKAQSLKDGDDSFQFKQVRG